ncbi:unnamed protein product [Trifolium pratense]|uniref:Uncharacterized protein n=1 Tax=Trifolium pratense TaxID=57577 RepID=A0ACB0J8P9_TRIPR|nr:unnamed protein product [Trifolium pratense]
MKGLINERYLIVKVDKTFSIINNRIIEDLSSSEVVETDEFLHLRFVNASFNNKPELWYVLPPLDVKENLNLELEVQTNMKSQIVETTIDEEGVFNLELEDSFNVNNNGMDCEIQTEATLEIEETKEKEGHVTNLSSLTTQYDVTSRTTQTEKLMNIYRYSLVMHLSSTTTVKLLDG